MSWQPLSEALEAGERPTGGFAAQSILVVEAGREADRLASRSTIVIWPCV